MNMVGMGDENCSDVKKIGWQVLIRRIGVDLVKLHRLVCGYHSKSKEDVRKTVIKLTVNRGGLQILHGIFLTLHQKGGFNWVDSALCCLVVKHIHGAAHNI